MIQGAIFDQDGLMFDTERIWMRSWKPALAELGLDYREGLAESTRGTCGDSFAAVIRDFYGPEVDVEGVREALSRIAFERIRRGADKKAGLDELLAWLSDRGIPCAVATSAPLEITTENLRNAGIEGFFSAVVTGDQITRAKPDPEIFQTAAGRLGTDPARTLVLEDSRQGLRAARAGGFITVMVPDLTPPSAETDALVDACCESLLDVRDLLSEGRIG